MVVYTHSIYNTERLMENQCEVNLLGGRLNRRNRFFGGGSALRQLETVWFDVAVLGAAAVRDDGIYFTVGEDAEVKRKVVERSDFIIVVTDESKFSLPGHYKGADFSDVDVFIVNKQPPSPIRENIEKAGVSLDILTTAPNATPPIPSEL